MWCRPVVSARSRGSVARPAMAVALKRQEMTLHDTRERLEEIKAERLAEEEAHKSTRLRLASGGEGRGGGFVRWFRTMDDVVLIRDRAVLAVDGDAYICALKRLPQGSPGWLFLEWSSCDWSCESISARTLADPSWLLVCNNGSRGPAQGPRRPHCGPSGEVSTLSPHDRTPSHAQPVVAPPSTSSMSRLPSYS
jgi:hypothetical protein